MPIIQNRRTFLPACRQLAPRALSAPPPAGAEPPPETTTVRLPQWIGSAFCWAGVYMPEN